MPAVLNHDRNAELTAYMARLPDDLIRDRPHLAAAAALMLVVSGEGDEADVLLESVGGSPRGSGRHTDDNSIVHGMAAATIVAADSDFLRGRIDLARDGYSRALAMCRTHRFHFLLMIVALRVLGERELYHGRLEQMERLVDEFLTESRRIGFANTAHEGQIRGFHATLAVLQHRPDVAFDRALELIRERGVTPESPIRVLGERELFAAVRAYRASGMPLRQNGLSSACGIVPARVPSGQPTRRK